MNKFFVKVLVLAVILTTSVIAFAQESVKEFLPAGEYDVTVTMKSSGRVLNGRLLIIKGNEGDKFLGSTYESFSRSVCSRDVVMTQKLSADTLSLVFTRPTLKDCSTDEWVLKKTPDGYSANLYTVIDGVRAQPEYASTVFKKK